MTISDQDSKGRLRNVRIVTKNQEGQLHVDVSTHGHFHNQQTRLRLDPDDAIGLAARLQRQAIKLQVELKAPRRPLPFASAW